MKVVVRDIGEELDDLLRRRMNNLIYEEKQRRAKGWTNAAEYFHARFIEAESIRQMLREFFEKDEDAAMNITYERKDGGDADE